MSRQPRQPLAERFWSRVRKTQTCWEWTGTLADGYGHMATSSSSAGPGQCLMGAHRVSWLLNVGPIVGNRYVLHHCDNRKCVRPDHLYLGSHMDNMRDMAMRGRARAQYGEANPNSKLTAEQVAEIRRLHKAKICTALELSKRYGVCRTHIYVVVKHRHWKDVV